MTTPSHGTRACYIAGCRRPECKQANHDYVSAKYRLIAYGRWQPWGDADAVRSHISRLTAAGMSLSAVGRAAGIASSAVCAIVADPTRKVKATTAATVLAIPVPTAAPRDSSAYTDATGTARRVQALMAVGWSMTSQAKRIGVWAPSLRKTARSGGQVLVSTAVAVTEMYDELWDQRPPATCRSERMSVAKTRAFAERQGWPPPVAWDDEVIDQPDGQPAEGWQRTRLSSAEIAEEALELFRQGYNLRTAAERLGRSKTAVDQALRRASEAA